MSIKKRYMSLILVVTMLIFSISSFAVDNTVNDTEDEVSQVFKNFLEPFYEGNRTAYKAISKNNSADVTENFYQETIIFYQQQDWAKIHDLFEENLQGMSKTETTYSQTASCSGDIAKNQSKTFLHTLKGIGGSEGYETYGRDMAYTLTGTIYYNPNTGIVSSAVGPTVTEMSIQPGDTNNIWEQTSQIARVMSNGAYANFSSTIHVYFSYFIMVDFGNVIDSFTIYPG
ncbi:hypothetical protein DW741_04730 [Ruminococcaceae bacterium AM28-23LB]|nr:hypothetical protein DW741_04730 [Ruminococcaceae bacterium AM28-23LB]